MKNIHKMIAVFLVVLLVLCGCGEKEVDLDYESLVVAPVDVSVTDCITEDQVTTVIGVPMTLLGVYEDGTQTIYTSEDGTCQVNVNLKNQTRELFNSEIDALGDAVTMVTSVGEVAYWCNTTGELLVYYNGYSLGVAVSIAGESEVDPYISQIAELIWKKLQPTE